MHKGIIMKKKTMYITKKEINNPMNAFALFGIKSMTAHMEVRISARTPTATITEPGVKQNVNPAIINDIETVKMVSIAQFPGNECLNPFEQNKAINEAR